MERVERFSRDEYGASQVQYALLLALDHKPRRDHGCRLWSLTIMGARLTLAANWKRSRS